MSPDLSTAEPAQKMTVAELMHGGDWLGADAAGWLAQEKFDGVRALWDGAVLWTRGGRRIAAPEFFTRGLPDRALDCELLGAHPGARPATALALAHCAPEAAWAGARLMVFDSPRRDGGFEQRMNHVRAAVAGHEFAIAAETTIIANEEVLRRELLTILERGGEGLMLRAPGSLYRAGRVTWLMKLKALRQFSRR